MSLQPGDKAPAFSLPTDGAGEVSLSRLRNRPFVLYFYPKDNTSGCTREALEFTKLHKKFSDLGVELVGISKDSVTSHDKFKANYRLSLTLASDSDTKIAQAYGVWVEKSRGNAMICVSFFASIRVIGDYFRFGS